MKPALSLLLVFLAGSGYASEEITVQLPGGAAMEMVGVQPGTFVMGSPETEAGRYTGEEEAQHEVSITEGFYLAKYELTQQQWQAVIGTSPWAVDNRVPQGLAP